MTMNRISMSSSIPTVKIVVARYTENIEWTEDYDNVLIYNKGPKLVDGYYREICLDNVGREGHTYYKYICDHYDALDDYTIFLQGHPFDHLPNILDELDDIRRKQRNGELVTAPVYFRYLTKPIMECRLSGCTGHPGLPIKQVYEYVFGTQVTEDRVFMFGSGAQFIVSRERILQRPREFYERIVALLQKDVCPVEGYVIERLHALIFEQLP